MTTPAPTPAPSPKRRTMTYNQVTSCPDMEESFLPIYEKAKPYTMTSLERMYGLHKAVHHVIANNIPGDLVECGVWKGGSMLVIIETLLALGITDKNLWLYDTFEGMPDPEPVDVQYDDITATEKLQQAGIQPGDKWGAISLEEVRQTLAATGYPPNKLHLIQGLVENTIPQTTPTTISLLRLDTDWYASTAHEMTHLYPRLSQNGILLIDDYGHWKGSRKAIDEYFTQHPPTPYLARLDYTGRIAVKP